jgi:hypothetical protein
MYIFFGVGSFAECDEPGAVVDLFYLTSTEELRLPFGTR